MQTRHRIHSCVAAQGSDAPTTVFDRNLLVRVDQTIERIEGLTRRRQR